MKTVFQTIAAQINYRPLLTKACLLSCALFALACFSTTSQAQDVPAITAMYVNRAYLCMQQGNPQCAATALTQAMRTYPPLAQNPQAIALLRSLMAGAAAQGAPTYGGPATTYTPMRSRAPRTQATNDVYRRCMEEARAMAKHPLDTNGSTVAQTYLFGTCRQLRDE